MKQAFLTFSFLVLVLLSNGQILRSPDVYSDLSYDSGITKVEKREFNGGDKRTLYELDSIGRVVEKRSFKKKAPSSISRYKYNGSNDIISVISTYDMTKPLHFDTLQYEYEYSNDKIVSETEKPSGGFSTSYRMIENKGDSILLYSFSRHFYSPDKAIKYQQKDTLIVTYCGNLRVKEEKIQDGGANKYITMYEYFDNGNVKRRVMKVFSMAGVKPMLIGATGADDETYKYSYDKNGRIRDRYVTRNSKTYKLTTYYYK